jgi:hypothetical protein
MVLIVRRRRPDGGLDEAQDCGAVGAEAGHRANRGSRGATNLATAMLQGTAALLKIPGASRLAA